MGPEGRFFAGQAGGAGVSGCLPGPLPIPNLGEGSPTRAGGAGTPGLSRVFCPAYVHAKTDWTFFPRLRAGKRCEACSGRREENQRTAERCALVLYL